MISIDHILYATDHSDNAKEACHYAKSIAEKYGSRITLLHVLPETFDFSVFDINMGRSSSEKKWIQARREYEEKSLKESIDRVVQEYSKEGVQPDEIIVEKGIPYKVILRVAEEKQCDFIVMGMKGEGRSLEYALMGDTIRKVLHHSKLPVLVVEPSAPGKTNND